MKKRKIALLAGIATFVILAAIIVIPLSSDLSLRLAIFKHTPFKAFTVKFKKMNPQPKEASNNETFYYIINDSIKNDGAGPDCLNSWVVYKAGPYHYAVPVTWGG